MRAALLSDIHANLQALEAVAKDLEDAAVDQIWCIGDIVGYGANPREALEWVERHADVVVKGNHDEAVATGDTQGFNPVAAAAARYHAQLLSPPERSRLLDLDATRHVHVPLNGGGAMDALVVHASPEDPLREYVYPTVARARIAEWAGGVDLLVMGHTHVPFAARCSADGDTGFQLEGFGEVVDVAGKQTRALTLVNPGSVGQPRDGDQRAAWAVVDFAQRAVELRRVAYDVDAASAAIRHARLDPFLANRLYRGA